MKSLSLSRSLAVLLVLCGLVQTVLAAAPAAPTEVKAAQTIHTGSSAVQFIARWKDVATDENVYIVEWRVNGTLQTALTQYPVQDSTYTTLTPTGTAFSSLAENTPISATVYAAKGSYTIVNGQTRVTVTEKSAGIASATFAFRRSATESSPSAPTNLSIQTQANDSSLGDGRLKFTWADNTAIEHTHEIRIINEAAPPASGTDTRFDDANVKGYLTVPFGSGIMNAILDTNATSQSLLPGVSYRARVVALATVRNASSQLVTAVSAPSNEVTFTMPALTQPQASFGSPARRVKAVATGEGTVVLNWQDSSNNERRYIVYAKPSTATSFTALQELNRNSTGTTLSPVYPGQTVTWRVVADASAMGSAAPATPNADDATDSLPVAIPALAAPTRLYAISRDSTDAGVTRVTLYWQDNSVVESGYELLSIPSGGGTAVTLGAVAANTTSVTLGEELTANTTYTLAVRAFSSGAQSDQSNSVTVQTRHGITSSMDLRWRDGFTYTLTASSAMTSSTVEPLPAGLAYNTSTHTLSVGNANEIVGGVYQLTFSATLADGFVAKRRATLRVVETPRAPLVVAPSAVTLKPDGTSTPEKEYALSSLFTDADTKSAVRVTTNLPAAASGFQSYDIILYPHVTPLSVNNMLTRLTDYTNTVVHRAPPGFVVQAGFFTPSTTTSGQYDILPARSSPTNEPGLSNVRGTVAWAKSAGAPNSATHDFFVNLADNAAGQAALDTQNAGFSVFGRVPTAGMAVVDAIAAKNKGVFTVPLKSESGTVGNSELEDWPVKDALPSSVPASTDLIQYTSVARIADADLIKLTASSADTAIVTAAVEAGTLKLNALAAGTTAVTLTATDLDGNVVNHTLNVTVDPNHVAPSITTQPVNTTVAPGGTATLEVTAAGTNLSYQWFRNGVALTETLPFSGTTNDELTITGAAHENAGSYTVVVSNGGGSVTSNAVTLGVTGVPVIVTPPASISRSYGQGATFSVLASGSQALSYQWKRNGVALANVTGTTGATAATLNLSSVSLNQAGDYTVVVSNGLGSVESSAATLTVSTIDSDGDGLTDDEELANGLNRNSADTDGDGYGDAVEVELGSYLAARSSTSTPARTHWVSELQADRTLQTLPFRLIDGSTQWLSTYEMTQAEFAAVLHWAYFVMNKVDIVESGSGPTAQVSVRYPKTTNNVICYLQGTEDSAVSGEKTAISLDSTRGSFYVPLAKARLPVGGVSWYGAYLAALVMNDYHGYLTKCNENALSFNGGAGYSIPDFTTWELAARGGAATLIYPTGNTASTALAFFNSTAALPKNVGSYRANALGIFDLAGNINEWTLNGPAGSGSHRYLRGGSWVSTDVRLKIDQPTEGDRDAQAMLAVDRHNGVRLALTGPANPTITRQPSPTFQTTARSLVLSVAATGTPPLVYQWFKNGVALPGRTTQSLVITAPTLAHAGIYHVTVASQGRPAVASQRVPVALVEQKTPLPLTTVATDKSVSMSAPAAAPSGYSFTYSWRREISNSAIYYDADTWFRKGVRGRTLSISPTFNGFVKDSNTTLAGEQPAYFIERDDTGYYVCSVGLRQTGVAGDVLPPVEVIHQLIVPQLPAVSSVTLSNSIVAGPFDFTPQPRVNPLNLSPAPLGASFLVTRWTITGLPPGLTYSTITGRITGRPTKPGDYTVVITAHNAQGSSDSVTALLRVERLPTEVVGDYVALVGRDSASSLGADLGGRLSLTTTEAGGYTGTLVLGTSSYRLTGALSQTASGSTLNPPTGELILPRAGKTSLKLSFSLALGTAGTFTGAVDELPAYGTGVLASTGVDGWRGAFNGVTPVGRTGLHPFVLQPPSSGSHPKGFSHGSMNVPVLATKHAVTVATRMADGVTVAVGTSPMSSDGRVLLFGSMYGGSGSVHGSLRIAADSGTARPVTAASPLTWLKKPSTAVARSYLLGFGDSSGLLLTVAGDHYAPRVAGGIPLGFPVTTGNNAKLVLADGGLASNIEQSFNLSSASTGFLTFPLANPNSVRLTMNLANGSFTGSFLIPGAAGRTGSISGVIFRDTSNAGRQTGRGFFTLPVSATGEILSGTVNVLAVP